jgi:hypothetical protein
MQDALTTAMTRAVDALSKDPAKATNPEVARALFMASGKGLDRTAALQGVLAQLTQPGQWPKDAHVAMAAALAAAERYGKAKASDLEAAQKLLVADQHPDGSYGSALDSWVARTALIASGMQPDNFTIVQIDKWSRGMTVENLTDATAATLLIELSSDVMAENLRRTSLGIIRPSQRPDGGFASTEGAAGVFDTALVVIALAMLDTEPRLARSTYRAEELKEAIAKGKAFLVAQQRPDGTWPEGLSANAWALIALLS